MKLLVRQTPDEDAYAVPIDLARPPVFAQANDGSGRRTVLNWDRCLDDEGFLRRCPVCGCDMLYARKPLPRMTVLAALVLLIALTLMAYGSNWAFPCFGLAVGLWVSDRVLLKRAPESLACYRCGSVFSQMPIRNTHPKWDRDQAERLGRAS